MVDQIQEFPVLNRALHRGKCLTNGLGGACQFHGVSYCHCDQFQATSGFELDVRLGQTVHTTAVI